MRTNIKTYGANKDATPYSNLIAACTQKAIEIDCNILEVSIYGDYGWACAAFLVDQFGGIAALVKYFIDGRYTGSYSGESASKTETFATIEEALAPVADAYKIEEKARENLEMFNCD